MMMLKGCRVVGEHKCIEIMMGDTKVLTLDKTIKTESGFLIGVDMTPDKLAHVEAAGLIGLQQGNTVSATEMHKLLGHVGEASMRSTAKSMEIKISGKLETCESCAKAKARQKNLVKETKSGATKPGERICMDITSIREKSFSGSISKYFLQFKKKRVL